MVFVDPSICMLASADILHNFSCSPPPSRVLRLMCDVAWRDWFSLAANAFTVLLIVKDQLFMALSTRFIVPLLLQVKLELSL